MTTLDELEKLADECARLNVNCPVPYKTLKQLITRQRELEALCRMQHEALSDCFKYMEKPPAQRLVQPYSQTANALAAYEQVMGEK